MAQNRRSELDSAVSSSDEEDDPSEEQEATESEGEEDKSSTKKPKTLKTPFFTPKSSDEDSQGESETDSDSPPGKSLNNPAEEAAKLVKKLRSEPSTPSTKQPGVGVKRPAEIEAKDLKKAKMMSTPSLAPVPAPDDDQKKLLFQRLWTEEDEIAILKGIMEYTSRKGTDPMNELHAFYEFIKKSIHCDVTKNQMVAKVRRLKKKYENNAARERGTGKDRTFSKAHEKKAYDLSKKIWGKKDSTALVVFDDSTKANSSSIPDKNNQNRKPNGSEKKNVDIASPAEVKKEDSVAQNGIEFSGSVGNVKFGDEMMKHGIDLINVDQKKELDEKWRLQRLLEAELFIKRLDLAREQMDLVIQALKSPTN
jgi:hypothetical protein